MDARFELHEGERFVQAKRHTPQALAEQVPGFIYQEMPAQHEDFFQHLDYLPLATLDSQGRPWASILVTRSNDDPEIGIEVTKTTLDLNVAANPADPFQRALTQQGQHQPFAGVGVDFSNRRRNKLAGTVTSAEARANRLSLHLNSDQHLGNCPKYITVRTLVPFTRKPEVVFDQFDHLSAPLPADAKSHIERSSTLFLATYYSATDKPSATEHKMGLNHRGGAPGFVRVMEESQGSETVTYLILPDHSGNRFYQSLGNIQSSGRVGLVFPDFVTGNMLYVTGEAENLFDQDAENLMPRVSLVTRIKIKAAVMIKDAIPLRLAAEEQLSPYNPPLRYLRQELEQMGHAMELPNGSSATATLSSIQHLTSNVARFDFELDQAIEQPLPGGFGVFDFSEMLDDGYEHMNEANPQAVNDDYVRTWTLSSMPEYSEADRTFVPSNKLSVTIKRKPGGLISNVLHHLAGQSQLPKFSLPFKGTGLGFSCLTKSSSGALTAPEKMLWIAGGVGLTPFLSMEQALRRLGIETDITLLFSGRDDDLLMLRQFDQRGTQVQMDIRAFQSSQDEAIAQQTREALSDFSALSITPERLTQQALLDVSDIAEREVYMCGPEVMMQNVEQWLAASHPDLSIHRESYAF